MTMKVKFIKDHLDHKIGNIATLDEGLSNYLIRVGVAEAYKEPAKEAKPAKGKKK